MTYKALVFCAVLLVSVAATPVVKRSGDIEVIALEEPCVRQGGLCMRTDDCPIGSTVQIRGVLCPMQQSLGVECCYV